ncbi:MAG: TIGR02266 family protein [Sandaracinaceae bacterium]
MSGIEVLRDEVPSGDALLEPLERLERALMHLHEGPVGAATLTASHHALAEVIALSADRSDDDLGPRARQCVVALARAQRILHPIAKSYGVPEPPEMPRRRRGEATDERRAHPRVRVRVDITFTSETNFFQGFTEDLSDGGLFLATYELKPVGTLIDVRFELPNGHEVETTGEVRWLREPRDEDAEVPPGMGIRFGDLTPNDRQQIAAYVARRAPLFHVE